MPNTKRWDATGEYLIVSLGLNLIRGYSLHMRIWESCWHQIVIRSFMVYHIIYWAITMYCLLFVLLYQWEDNSRDSWSSPISSIYTNSYDCTNRFCRDTQSNHRSSHISIHWQSLSSDKLMKSYSNASAKSKFWTVSIWCLSMLSLVLEIRVPDDKISHTQA